MMRTLFVCVSTAVLLMSAAAYAHHSYGATYDTSKQVTLEGKLVQFVYRNPHSGTGRERRDAALVRRVGGNRAAR